MGRNGEYRGLRACMALRRRERGLPRAWPAAARDDSRRRNRRCSLDRSNRHRRHNWSTCGGRWWPGSWCRSRPCRQRQSRARRIASAQAAETAAETDGFGARAIGLVDSTGSITPALRVVNRVAQASVETVDRACPTSRPNAPEPIEERAFGRTIALFRPKSSRSPFQFPAFTAIFAGCLPSSRAVALEQPI